MTALAGGASLALALSACGGSKSSPTTTARAQTSTATTSAAQTGTSQRTSTQTSPSPATGQIEARFTGESHSPKANKSWSYTVSARDAHGHPLSGSVQTEFTFAGQVVGRETPPVHQLTNGVLRDVVTFPSTAIGQPLAVQVVIHTGAGTKTLTWPVQVSP